MQSGYALHETLEVHELAAFMTVCLIKSKTMKALASDEALKGLMQAGVDLSTRHLEQLRVILQQAKS